MTILLVLVKPSEPGKRPDMTENYVDWDVNCQKKYCRMKVDSIYICI